MATVNGLTVAAEVVVHSSDMTMTLLRKRRWYRIAVIGAGQFPIDMLRYDKCWPAAGVLEVDGPERIVVIESRSEGYWTPDRWSSFGWIVVNDLMVYGRTVEAQS